MNISNNANYIFQETCTICKLHITGSNANMINGMLMDHAQYFRKHANYILTERKMHEQKWDMIMH